MAAYNQQHIGSLQGGYQNFCVQTIPATSNAVTFSGHKLAALCSSARLNESFAGSSNE